MIFLTVGTQISFDRLVKAVDEAVERGQIAEEIYAQIGMGLYQPRNFRAVSFIEKHLFDKHIRQASCVISHAGIGVITAVLDNKKPLLVMPRRKKYGEAVNDHQVAIAQKFEELGHLLVAYYEEDLPKKIAKLKFFVPQVRDSDAKAVINKISEFLNFANLSV